MRSSHSLMALPSNDAALGTTFVHASDLPPPPDALSASPSLTISAPAASASGGALETNVHLQLLFQYYCRFGRSGVDHDIDTMDCGMFAKFSRDCPDLLDRALNATEVDLLFVKAKSKAARRITYGQVRR